MPGQQFKCKFCEEKFGDIIKYKMHLGLKHSNENFSENDLIREMIQTLKSNTKQSEETIMIEKLEAHCKEVDEPRPISMMCDACGREFEDQLVLKRHMKQHIQHIKFKLKKASIVDRPFQCQQCPKNYKLAMDLNRHMKIHTGEGLFTCQECHKGFTGKASLRLHMLKHTGEKPFPCHLCDKKFRRNCELQVHLKLHSGELDFSCKICGRKFEVKSALKIHAMTHSEERAFDCPYCDGKFKTNTARNTHVQAYHLERNFICDICNDGYPSKTHLFQHIRTHKKHFPHKCETCKMRFLNPTSLDEHASLHQKGMTVFCEICEEGFPNRRESNLHHKEKHKGVPLSTKDYKSTPGPNSSIAQAVFLPVSTDVPDDANTDPLSGNTSEQSSTSMDDTDTENIPQSVPGGRLYHSLGVESLNEVMIKTEIPEPECLINEESVEPEQVLIKEEPN